ncbi:glycerol-3-phosphate acyltransferase [Rummeliibacillus sp. NPDC094406]|uniref:glycerol-3-phosphate acyltransferase n=1 Tax=Rummeliibacillus sp. NPDC094406 TaxID=3364511 RepID=UPI0038291039
MENFYYLLFCYFIGTFMSAWFVGNWYGISLQQKNSGNLGARNAGRTLGKWAFVITLLFDGLKGALVVYIGRFFEFDEIIVSFGVVICIFGHLFPFWLRLKGGKGVATMIGGLLSLNPLLFLMLICGTVMTLPFTKSLTSSMMFGFLTYSFCIYLLHLPMYSPIIISFLFITWKHRENLMERVI